MFKFTLLDKFRQRGISPDAISPEMRNRFDAIFENKCENSLDRKVQVRLNEKIIRFFFYTGDVDEDVLLEKNYVEIASISLANEKETGHDILDFKKQVKKRTETVSLSGVNLKEHCDVLIGNSAYKRLFGFPFVKQFELMSDTNDKVLFPIFMQCCLLYFILDMENRSSDLALSPLYEDVCLKLRQSDVYQLLCAKLKYTIHLYEGASPHSQDDYTFVTRKFADRLMNSSINKVIPPYNYPEKNEQANNTDKQLWFYNPETELETILEKNREQELLSTKDNPRCLEDTLILKVRDFFYAKHAVYQAMTRNVGKRLFLCAQILMAITSLSILVSSFFSKLADCILHTTFPIIVCVFSVFSLVLFLSESIRANQKKQYRWEKAQMWVLLPLGALLLSAVICILCKSRFYQFYTIIILSIFIWIYCSGRYNNPNSNKKANGAIYAFYPRILVAEVAAWLTIGIAEDLVKSMLWIEPAIIPIIATISVFTLIAIILSGKAKQHSPYKHNYFTKKVLPILNHSIFFALLIGIVMQVIFYDNLIKNSDVLTSVVFNDYFDDGNYYCEQLEDLDNTITQYESLSFLETNVQTNSRSEVKQDSVSLKTNLKADLSLFTDLNEYISIHNGVVTNFNDISIRLEKDSISLKPLQKAPNSQSYTLPHNSVKLDAIQTNSIDTIRSVRNANLEMVISMRPPLCNEISLVRSLMLKYNNYDTLMNWATIGQPSNVKTGSHYLDTLTSKAIKSHNCCKQINLPVLEKLFKAINIPMHKFRIFPTLLIFHTLIVLILAFVTQLLISDKSVTEPL